MVQAVVDAQAAARGEGVLRDLRDQLAALHSVFSLLFAAGGRGMLVLTGLDWLWSGPDRF